MMLALTMTTRPDDVTGWAVAATALAAGVAVAVTVVLLTLARRGAR